METLKKVLTNPYFSAGVALIAISYASAVAPKLPQSFMKVLDNPIFKIIFLIIVALVAGYNPMVAIIVAIAFVVTLTYISEYKTTEAFLGKMVAD